MRSQPTPAGLRQPGTADSDSATTLTGLRRAPKRGRATVGHYLPEADLVNVTCRKAMIRETARSSSHYGGSLTELDLTAIGWLPKVLLAIKAKRDMRMPPVVLSSDSHVFEPPDLWQNRIDAPFRDRAPRIQRIDGADQIVVEAGQILSGIGLISNAGARF